MADVPFPSPTHLDSATSAVAYVSSALGQRQACAHYWEGDSSEAISMLDRTESLLEREAAALDDAELEHEPDVVAQLCRNMQSCYNGYSTSDQEDDVTNGYPACSVPSRDPSQPDAVVALLRAAALYAGLRGTRSRKR